MSPLISFNFDLLGDLFVATVVASLLMHILHNLHNCGDPHIFQLAKSVLLKLSLSL